MGGGNRRGVDGGRQGGRQGQDLGAAELRQCFGRWPYGPDGQVRAVRQCEWVPLVPLAAWARRTFVVFTSLFDCSLCCRPKEAAEMIFRFTHSLPLETAASHNLEHRPRKFGPQLAVE